MVNNNFDNCTSFHIDNGAFMGRLVRLDKVVNTILGRHQYPRQVSAVVAESTALGALLSSTIKYNGLFTLQTQSSGPVTMVVVDVTSEGRIRACANVNQEMLDKALELRKSDTDELLAAPHYMGNGHLAFTVDQGPETDLYQGIVDLQGKNLSECALRYFKQSEQIETYLQLFLQAPDKDGESWKAAGILLQKLPDNGGKISDDTRIRGALPTLKKILADGGALIIMSHMGKPKGKVNAKLSLSQIKDAVAAALGTDVKFAPDCAKAADAAAALKPGEVLLLENLRFYPEEEGKPVGIDKEDPAYDAAKKEMKESQKEFAKTLASYADCYVNDAFGTAHRRHASTAVIADYFDADNKMLGYLMEKEVTAVENVLNNIKRPFTAIMGGSKVSTKIGIIENLMDKVDNLILCGGMTYTFAKAQGGKIGVSICEDDKLDLALDIIKKAKEKGVNLVLGTDCVAADKFSNDANTQVCPSNDIPEGWEGMDAGPATRELFANAIKDAKTILWNGPAGVFEFDNFTAGSRAIADAIVEATEKGAFSLVGGGDSVACVNKFGLADKVSYVSTGGGALLEAIEGKVLPGIAAIKG